MQRRNGKERSLMGEAIQGIGRNPSRLVAVMLCQLLLRLAALAPAALGFLGMGGEKIPSILFYALTLLLYVLLVVPFRFRAGEWMRYFADGRKEMPGKKTEYFVWLKKGLIRLGRGLPFGIPVFAIIGYLVIGSQVLPYNQMWRPVMNLALIFGMEPTLLYGILAGLPLVFLLVLFFCLGWLRDMPVEYMLPGDRAWHREERKKARRLLIGNFFVNALLLLPAVMGICLILFPYILSNVDFSGSVLKTIADMTKLIEQPFPAGRALLLLGDFIILYLPLCALRKMRNAVLTKRILGGKHAA